MSNASKQELRLRLRTKRNSLSQAERDLAAQRLRDNVCQLPAFRQAQNLAGYWPYDAEISPIPLLNAALAQGKNCFLPVLVPGSKQLLFAAYTHDTTMVKNQHGILEPELADFYMSCAALDVIFVPLVGFDSQGQRLGMGGGFYDATFVKGPQLIGLAYQCQQIEQVPTDNWDWQLNAVVTDMVVLEV